MSVGLLFPGQGSQHVGMGQDLANRFPTAREVFAAADDALGFALSDLCWRGPEAELTQTENAQPAILVHSLAVWEVVRSMDLPVIAAAGHSLGEWSAYGAAGSLAFADTVRTVRLRGELMSRAGAERPGTMAAVLGLDDAELERVCAEASAEGETVVAANFNAPGQVVISGDPAAVARVAELARSAGAKRVLPLNVSGAFHSPLVASAEGGLRAQLDTITVSDPAFPVVANVTAQPVRDAFTARSLLVRQLTAPVRWVGCVHAMLDLGVTHFLELGPGNVLTGLARRIEKGASAQALGTADSLDTFLGAGATSWS